MVDTFRTPEINFRSELDELRKDITEDIAKKRFPDAIAHAMQNTLQKSEDLTQRILNRSITGGPANAFIGKNAINWNIGKLFGNQKGRTADRNAFTGDSFRGGLRRGFIFIQPLQAQILEAALESLTINNLEYASSGKSVDPFILPDSVKQIRLKGKLALRKNNKGNIVGFRKGSLAKLKEAARKKPTGNKPFSIENKLSDEAKYFEVERTQRTRNGLTLYAGIYRRERSRSKRSQGTVRAILYYRDRLTYRAGPRNKLARFKFDKTITSTFNKFFIRELERCLDKELREYR